MVTGILIALAIAYNTLLFLFLDTLNLYIFVGALSLLFDKYPSLEDLKNFMSINFGIVLLSLVLGNLYIMYTLKVGMNVMQAIFTTMLLFFEVQVILYPLFLKKTNICEKWTDAFIIGFITPIISVFSIYLYTQIIYSPVYVENITLLALILFALNLFIGYGVIALLNIVTRCKCFRCKKVFAYSSVFFSAITIFLIWIFKYNKALDLLFICMFGALIPYFSLLEDTHDKESLLYVSLGIFAILLALAMYAVSAKIILDTISSYNLYKILHIH